MIIYKITNKITGKCYIGQTIQSLQRRWYKHCHDNRCPALRDAIKKYGQDNFTIEVIDTATTIDELNEKEIYWISFYNSLVPNGYNLQTGGKNSRCAESTKKKLSELNRGENHPLWGTHRSQAVRDAVSNARKGIKFTDEHRKHLSESHKGVVNECLLKKVKCVETGQIFNSIKEAKAFCGNNNIHIGEVCRGKRATAGGYHWQYYEQEVI